MDLIRKYLDIIIEQNIGLEYDHVSDTYRYCKLILTYLELSDGIILRLVTNNGELRKFTYFSVEDIIGTLKLLATSTGNNYKTNIT